MRQPTRRAFATGSLLLTMSAAGGAWAQTTTNTDALSIGSATAPIHLVEYASMSCPHCAHFHSENWAQLKANYIDSGRVRLTMQEMLTEPAVAAFAMFQLARCGNVDGAEYFRRMGILFDRQRALMATGTVGALLESLVATGGEWGLTREQIMASLNDSAGEARISRSIAVANAAGVNSTPTFFVNGQRAPDDFATPAGMVRTLDAALAR
ncbi:MAG: thioredoxin domain-containing protein [Hyphomonadaceae bacterium]|jgi:protein-disulfide isomerase|nr:thioredoxin domain-containing protein [Hyphomonadaceae bacterium]